MVRSIFWILLLFFSFQQGTTASDRYAFVSVYYPNNHRSLSDLIAIRTLYKSYVSIKSKAEFLVLSTKDIPQSDLNTFKEDGISVKIMKMKNAYKNYDIVPYYQQTLNLEYLWDLVEYKRVIFVDPYSLLTHNFDSLFDCSYLCLRDEQPLLYSNTMIVITPGHQESRELFNRLVRTQATIDQYSKYNRIGYYSTELYELSQAAPVFELGDSEKNDQIIRRFLNFVHFPIVMWYEKFNWDLYSCSGLNDPTMPVYSINFQYTLGHKEMFLPTHWISYYYVWAMNDYWLSWRSQLNESFFTTHFYCLLIAVCMITVGILVSPIIAQAVTILYQKIKPFMKQLNCASAIMKLGVSLIILGIWYVSFSITPYHLYPSSGYFYFYLYYSILAAIFIIAFNSGTNTALGINQSFIPSILLLCCCHGVYAFVYCTAVIERIPWLSRVALMFVQFFIELYCIYSQLSPLQNDNKILYTSLPE